MKGNNPCLFWFVCLKYFSFPYCFIRDHLSHPVLETFTFVKSDCIEDVHPISSRDFAGLDSLCARDCSRLEAVRLCRELFQYCLIIVGRT